MKKSYDEKSWSFLIASPSFEGAVFEESVILLIDDTDDGAFGIILNRPEDKILKNLDASFSESLLGDLEVFEGGPIARENLSFALWMRTDGDECGKFSFGVKPESVLEALASDPEAKAAAFLGYAGWAAGQLQGEIDEGVWLLSDVDMDFVFSTAPEVLWKEALLRRNPEFRELPLPETDELGDN